MIVPLWAKLLAGAGLLVLGAWGGYTINDAMRDSEDLAKLNAAIEKVDAQTTRLKTAGDTLEKSRDAERSSSTVRENTIREIYRDRPVAADCALDPAAGRVLDDAIATANARASGKPYIPVPSYGPPP